MPTWATRRISSSDSVFVFFPLLCFRLAAAFRFRLRSVFRWFFDFRSEPGAAPQIQHGCGFRVYVFVEIGLRTPCKQRVCSVCEDKVLESGIRICGNIGVSDVAVLENPKPSALNGLGLGGFSLGR